MVRLKVDVCYLILVNFDVSIPYGTIKSRVIILVLFIIHIVFQFLMVRLKVNPDRLKVL